MKKITWLPIGIILILAIGCSLMKSEASYKIPEDDAKFILEKALPLYSEVSTIVYNAIQEERAFTQTEVASLYGIRREAILLYDLLIKKVEKDEGNFANSLQLLKLIIGMIP